MKVASAPAEARTDGWGQEAPGAAAAHLATLQATAREVQRFAPTLEGWGEHLAEVLTTGGRVLAAGNGGSAAEAQHFTAELVGRFQHERPGLAAIALHADTSTLTALVNDYGFEAMFARQVEAHGRPGDVLLLLSTSGRSPNVCRAAAAGRACGLTVWALTGPLPNPLAALADAAVAVEVEGSAAVQEGHLALLHALCAAVDARIVAPAGPR